MWSNWENIGKTYVSKGKDLYSMTIRWMRDRAYATMYRHVADACDTDPPFLPAGFSRSVQNGIVEGAWHRTASRFQRRIGCRRAIRYLPINTPVTVGKPYDILETGRSLWSGVFLGYCRRSPPVFETGFVNLP